MKQHNIIQYNVKLHPGGGRGGDRGEGIKRRRGGNKGGWIFFFFLAKAQKGKFREYLIM